MSRQWKNFNSSNQTNNEDEVDIESFTSSDEELCEIEIESIASLSGETKQDKKSLEAEIESVVSSDEDVANAGDIENFNSSSEEDTRYRTDIIPMKRQRKNKSTSTNISRNKQAKTEITTRINTDQGIDIEDADVTNPLDESDYKNMTEIATTSGGLVQKLENTLKDMKMEYHRWFPGNGIETSQSKEFEISNIQKSYGVTMVLFTLDNEKCAIFLNSVHHSQLIKKLKPYMRLIFSHADPPYKINDVNVYTGVAKLRIKQ